MTEEIKNKIEEELMQLPLVQYAWTESGSIPFSDRARSICREECPRYGKSWSCPPGVGSVEQCRSRCESYSGVFVFTTIAEVQDVENMEETLRTRREHEAVTRQVRAILEKYTGKTLALSGESCAVCETCAWPKEPCRHPEKMIPCMEGYGIVVPLLAERTGIEFFNGSNTVTWFGMVLFTE